MVKFFNLRFIHLKLAPTLLILGVALSWSSQTNADIYIYKNEWGSSLFSDRPIKQAGFQLMEVRRADIKGQVKLAKNNLTKGSISKDFDSTDNLAINTSRYDREITQLAQSYDVDPALVKAVIHAESHFNPHAVSRVGAQGLMQLMPQTAAMYQVSNPYNPQENISAGCRHLQYLMGKFDSLDLVLAAYNAGEGTVNQYNGIPPYSETRNYVRKVKQLQASYAKQSSFLQASSF